MTPRKFERVLVANRSEIAIRVFRACTELGIRTIGIFSKEDRSALHRYKADESYPLDENLDPLKAYLDIQGIVTIAKRHGADAIHPGYGFLSENPELARACRKAGIAFVGPPPEILEMMGDKTAARKEAHQSHPVTRLLGPIRRYIDTAKTKLATAAATSVRAFIESL